MHVIESIQALRYQVDSWKKQGFKIAFVPTMGNLHEGHLSLIDVAKQQADKVVSSVFVNPLQFGPNEDFDRYPRTFEADSAKLIERGADALFVPSVEEMYPNGQAQTLVCVPSALTDLLEGASRPGHFDGVTTVVAKLFNMVQPDVAVFGQKDFQQFAVIAQMVKDMAMPIELIRAPIGRDSDGLALSSRNQYLSDSQRQIAPKLCVVLQDVVMALQSGNAAFAMLEASAKQQLLQEGFDLVDYVSIVNSDTLLPAKSLQEPLVVLGVARLGQTRLLDNLLFEKTSTPV